MGTVLVQACAVENLTPEGVCTVPLWVEKPEQVLPVLTLAEGTAVAFGIAGVWTVGLIFRLIARSTQQRQF
jgi:hypothetical protein